MQKKCATTFALHAPAEPPTALLVRPPEQWASGPRGQAPRGPPNIVYTSMEQYTNAPTSTSWKEKIDDEFER